MMRYYVGSHDVVSTNKAQYNIKWFARLVIVLYGFVRMCRQAKQAGYVYQRFYLCKRLDGRVVYRNTASGEAEARSVSKLRSDVTNGASLRGVLESLLYSAPMDNVQVGRIILYMYIIVFL